MSVKIGEDWVKEEKSGSGGDLVYKGKGREHILNFRQKPPLMQRSSGDSG